MCSGEMADNSQEYHGTPNRGIERHKGLATHRSFNDAENSPRYGRNEEGYKQMPDDYTEGATDGPKRSVRWARKGAKVVEIP